MERLHALLSLLALLTLAGCNSGPKQISQEELREYFASHRVGAFPDYGIIKNGTDYVATIHGYVDNRSVCLQLIAPYNKNPGLSTLPGTYSCIALNK